MRGDARGSGGGAAYPVNGGRTKPLGIKGAGRMPSAVLITRLVLPEHVAHRPADLAHRSPVVQRVVDERQEVVLALGRVAQLLQPPLDQLGVAVGLERLQPLDLVALGLRIHAQRLGHPTSSVTYLLTPTTMSCPWR